LTQKTTTMPSHEQEAQQHSATQRFVSQVTFIQTFADCDAWIVNSGSSQTDLAAVHNWCSKVVDVVSALSGVTIHSFTESSLTVGIISHSSVSSSSDCSSSATTEYFVSLTYDPSAGDLLSATVRTRLLAICSPNS
jgi:hypothetical protein